MNHDVFQYRKYVLDALGRMAEIEERLRVEASESGDEYLEGMHGHGRDCLREAQSAVRSVPGV